MPTLLKLLVESEPVAVRMAALSALQPFPDRTIADAVLARYPQMPPSVAERNLVVQPHGIDAGISRCGGQEPDQSEGSSVRSSAPHPSCTTTRRSGAVEKHWGQVGQEPPGEKRARINSVKHMLGTGTGEKPSAAIAHAGEAAGRSG